MRSIIVRGNRFLKGTVYIDGSKNASIPLLTASLLAKGRVLFKNVPRIKDVEDIISILKYLDCKVIFKGSTVFIDNTKLRYKPLLIEECKRIRGSYYFIGVFLALFGKCEILLPGGCKIGSRPIDVHLEAFKDLGYNHEIKDDVLYIYKNNDISDVSVNLKKKSVGASINALFASLNLNRVEINNCLFEPEGLDVIKFLKEVGYNINLINNRIIYCKSNLGFKVIKHKVIPDRIEAMTYVVLGLLNGSLKIKNIRSKDLEYPLFLLKNAGYLIKYSDNEIEVYKSVGEAISFKTSEYPGFPTDLQPIFGCLEVFSIGESFIEECIFENRLKFYEDLKNIGLDIKINNNLVKIIGTGRLEASNFFVSDLRHGAAIIILTLKMDGESVIDNFELVERGYTNILGKLRALGADIKEK